MRTVTHRIPGLILTDHEFAVPFDYARSDGEQITFPREVVAPGKEGTQVRPGWSSSRAARASAGRGRTQPPAGSKRALQEFRVLLLDDRGTGRSTPVTHQTLAWRGSPQAQADYVADFRAEGIVRRCGVHPS